ncbi:MAG: hypothetical protein Q9161_003321 [Pseudevernia consocians]
MANSVVLSLCLALQVLARPQGPWQGIPQGPPQGPPQGAWSQYNHHGQWNHDYVPTTSSLAPAFAQTPSPSTAQARNSESTTSYRFGSFTPSGSAFPSPTGTFLGTGSALGTGYIPRTSPASVKTSPATEVTFFSGKYTESAISNIGTSAASKRTSTSIGAPVATSSNSLTSTEFMRGVNIGGWLLAEKFMNSDDLFTGNGEDAVDQWTLDQTSGAATALQKHWDTYFTEADVQILKTYGINALRIPIGFCYDNSGHKGDVEWQQGDNLAKSIAILTTIAQKYGSKDYSDTVMGIELVNEPISWGNNTLSTTQTWAQEAYHAVKGNSTNENLMVVMHDAFAPNGPSDWTGIAKSLGPRGVFGIDTHMYQTLVPADIALTQAEHITTACQRGMALSSANELAPVYVGEWSSTTNACINPDGTSTAGTCSAEGCVCVTDPMDTWTDTVVEEVRKFVEAQLESFEANDDMGTWSIKDGINKGIIPNPLNDPNQRKYPGQCSS